MSAITERLNLSKLVPEAYEILVNMEKYLSTTAISSKNRELIKIRASQINKCAYCLDMHTRDARKAGESEQRLYAITAWEESPLFTEEERALLSFTEAVTKISEHGVSEDVYNKMSTFFSEKEIAQIIMIINQINCWNRNAIVAKITFNPA